MPGLMLRLLQGGPGCISSDWPAASPENVQKRRKRSTDRRLYDILLQRLEDLRAPMMPPSDYDYIDEQQQQLAMTPYQRKRNTGRCYFHAINCW